MDWDTLPEIWSCLIIRMLTRQAVWRISRALLSADSLWVLLNILDEQEAEDGCFEHHLDRIHSYEYDLVWSCLVAEALHWAVCTHDGYHHDLLCQPGGIRLLRNPVFYHCSSVYTSNTTLSGIWYIDERGGSIALRLMYRSQTFCRNPRERSNLWLSRTTWSRWETLLWGSCMMHALSFGSSGGLGVLLRATSDHRATHPPLIVRCV